MTMMPCENTTGDCSPTIFVYNGSKRPYKLVVCDDCAHVETLGSCLHLGALV